VFLVSIVMPMILTSPAGKTGAIAMKIEHIGSVSPAFTIRITVGRVPCPSAGSPLASLGSVINPEGSIHRVG
jgi:hypothetical protein